MNLVPFVILWGVVAVATLGLAFWRNLLSLHEDDNIHVADSEVNMIPNQIVVGRKIEAIERWGKSLTVVTALFGAALLCVFLYQGWVKSNVPF